MFNGEALDKLAKFSRSAPSLIQSKNTFEHVLSGSDTYNTSISADTKSSFYEVYCIECRRILFSILYDQRSPVLKLTLTDWSSYFFPVGSILVRLAWVASL